MRQARIPCLWLCLLALVAACKPDAASNTQPANRNTATSDAAARYVDLARLDCDGLATLLAQVIGKRPHERNPVALNLGGETIKGGCALDTSDLSSLIEIHLASTSEHSLPWTIMVPDTAAEKAAHAVTAGDEAYAVEFGGKPALIARKGFVEVAISTTAIIQRQPFLTSAQMQQLAALILKDWPSGAGPARDEPPPPNVPLPPGAVVKDFKFINVKALAAKYDRLGLKHELGKFSNSWVLSVPLTARQATEYCAALEAAGYRPVNDLKRGSGTQKNQVECVAEGDKYAILFGLDSAGKAGLAVYTAADWKVTKELWQSGQLPD